MSYKVINPKVIYEDNPTVDFSTSDIDVSLVDQIVIQVINTNDSKTASVDVSIESSLDGVNFVELESTVEKSVPTSSDIMFTMSWVPFQIIRVKFANINTAGDGFKIMYSAKGV